MVLFVASHRDKVYKCLKNRKENIFRNGNYLLRHIDKKVNTNLHYLSHRKKKLEPIYDFSRILPMCSDNNRNIRDIYDIYDICTIYLYYFRGPSKTKKTNLIAYENSSSHTVQRVLENQETKNQQGLIKSQND